jgi:hypothetical protein
MRRQSWVEFLYIGIIGWIWIAASLVAVYFLVRAIFFGDGWWRFVASAAAAWFLYKVTLYYQLDPHGVIRPGNSLDGNGMGPGSDG